MIHKPPTTAALIAIGSTSVVATVVVRGRVDVELATAALLLALEMVATDIPLACDVSEVVLVVAIEAAVVIVVVEDELTVSGMVVVSLPDVHVEGMGVAVVAFAIVVVVVVTVAVVVVVVVVAAGVVAVVVVGVVVVVTGVGMSGVVVDGVGGAVEQVVFDVQLLLLEHTPINGQLEKQFVSVGVDNELVAVLKLDPIKRTNSLPLS